jgi:hypothetical protein
MVHRPPLFVALSDEPAMKRVHQLLIFLANRSSPPRGCGRINVFSLLILSICYHFFLPWRQCHFSATTHMEDDIYQEYLINGRYEWNHTREFPGQTKASLISLKVSEVYPSKALYALLKYGKFNGGTHFQNYL